MTVDFFLTYDNSTVVVSRKKVIIFKELYRNVCEWNEEISENGSE